MNTPFESAGHFFAGHIRQRHQGKLIKRRCLCFALSGAVVGASVNFSRAEAYHTAVRAASGRLPLPDRQATAAATLSAILRTRGYPILDVTDPTVEVDDETAMVVGKEFAR